MARGRINFGFGGGEGVIEVGHENAPLQINDCKGRQAI